MQKPLNNDGGDSDVVQNLINFTCKNCKKFIEEVATLAGKPYQCPSCKITMLIPVVHEFATGSKSNTESKNNIIDQTGTGKQTGQQGNKKVRGETQNANDASHPLPPQTHMPSIDGLSIEPGELTPPSHRIVMGSDDVKLKSDEDFANYLMSAPKNRRMRTNAGRDIATSTSRSMNCLDCRKYVSRNSSFCPHCGSDLGKQKPTNQKREEKPKQPKAANATKYINPRISREKIDVAITHRSSETISSRAFHPIDIPPSETTSDSNPVEPLGRIGAIALITIVGVIAIGGILNIDSRRSSGVRYEPISLPPSHSQASVISPAQNPSKPNSVPPRPSAPSSNEFRKDFFASVHRAAVQFNPDSPEFPDQLREELQLIVDGAKTEREKEVLNLFDKIEETQRSIAAIEELWEGTKNVRSQYEQARKQALGAFGIDGARSLLQSLKHQEEVAVACNKGLALVASHLSSTNALALCQKHNLQILQFPYGAYTPYQPSQEKLKIILQALLTTAGQLIHNDGSLKAI